MYDVSSFLDPKDDRFPPEFKVVHTHNNELKYEIKDIDSPDHGQLVMGFFMGVMRKAGWYVSVHKDGNGFTAMDSYGECRAWRLVEVTEDCTDIPF